MEELLKQLLEGQKRIETRLDSVETRLESIETRLDSVEAKIDAEFKNSKESDAAILGLIEKTYKKAEQIDAIADDINYLLQRNAKHDNELRELRKVL
ncbi:hypothetical protein SRRS_52660 [Sporomusa rhizae]|uniref:hypothetical protein n=1 Tax=Sporomusa rhizae TaxID=357999 RepID=UPI00352ABC19